MNIEELPQITSSCYGGHTGWVGDLCLDQSQTPVIGRWSGQMTAQPVDLFSQIFPEITTSPTPMANQLRIVQVFVADTNENITLDKRILYRGDPKVTDLTDQELYYEIPIMELLKVHNQLRAETVDKEASKRSGKDVFLEPARVRDLRMAVVNIAVFQ